MVPVGRSLVGSRRASGRSRPRRVRASDQGIAFAISLRDDEDVEVVLPADACEQLNTALRRAQQSTA